MIFSSAAVLLVETKDDEDSPAEDDQTNDPDPVYITIDPYSTNYTSTSSSKGNILYNETTFLKEVPEEELQIVAELENKEDFITADPNSYDNYFGDERNMVDGEENAQVGEGEEREIEEADIVKIIDDHLFVLNPYRGLIVIDLQDPDSPEIMSRAPVFGYPVEMYVVDSLAYVILNTNYNFWYNYWMFWESEADMIPIYQIGSQIMIIDISDVASPQVIQKIDLEGFVSNTRRVGDVIYAVSNCYAWYNHYFEGLNYRIEDETYITSINIEDPGNIYEVERVHFQGSSNEIHVTTEAIFVAQPSYLGWQAEYRYITNVTYVDISDPQGDIEIFDTFTAEGWLSDRYQMDYFSGTFRIVTHFWRNIGESELRIFDVSDPSDVRLIGHLIIDDAGSLMATRFEGKRGYTIHLPRSIDPLDVLDLSDPTNPKLTDILEIPGWITHMEVRGYNILALGVDDSSGNRKVAVSLFDVTDPYNAKLLDRVNVGEGGSGGSWSNANWDPKALTVLDDQGVILVPFTGRVMNENGKYDYIDGVQIVEFDLETGKLDARGIIEHTDMVTRTRVHQDRILATSTKLLQVIDATDRDQPRITARVELCANILDVIEKEGYTIQLVKFGWDDPLKLRTVHLSDVDSGQVLSEIEIQAGNGRIFHSSDSIYFSGYGLENHENFVTVFDIADPLNIRQLGSLTLPEGSYPYYYSYGYYYGSYYMYGSPYYYPSYSSENPLVLDDDHLVYYQYHYGNYPVEEDVHDNEEGDDNPDLIKTTISQKRMYSAYVVSLSDRENPSVSSEISFWAYGAYDLKIRNGILYFSDTAYLEEYYQGNRSRRQLVNYLGRIDLNDPEEPRELTSVNIPGRFVDIDDDGNTIYTVSHWWSDGDKAIQTFNILSLEGNQAILRSAFLLNDTLRGVEIIQGKAYITTSSWKYYGWYWCDYVVMKRYGYNYDPGHIDLTIVDLSDPGDPVVVSRIESSGTGSLLFVKNGFAFIQMDSNTGILVYDVTEPTETRLVGLYLTQTSVIKIRVYGNYAYLMQGNYGVMVIQLSS